MNDRSEASEDDFRFLFDTRGMPIGTESLPACPESHYLIEECMILANFAVSRILANLELRSTSVLRKHVKTEKGPLEAVLSGLPASVRCVFVHSAQVLSVRLACASSVSDASLIVSIWRSLPAQYSQP